MNIVQLHKIYADHQLWLESDLKEGARADLSGHQLQHYDFSHMNLSYADFGGANLHSCNFTCTNLSHARMTRATCEHAVFIATDLTTADLTGATLKNAYICDIKPPFPTPTGDIVVWLPSVQEYEIIEALIPADAHRIRLLREPTRGFTHRIIPLSITHLRTNKQLQSVEMCQPYWQTGSTHIVRVNEPFDSLIYNAKPTDWLGGDGIRFWFDKDVMMTVRRLHVETKA